MAMKTFNVGDVLTAADTNEYLVNTKFVAKSADQSVTSSVTYVDDTHLTLSVDANKTYRFELGLWTTGDPGNLKVRLAFPASATVMSSISGIDIAGTGATNDTFTNRTGGTPTTDLSLGVTAGTASTLWLGTLAVAGTAGTFKLQWAQDTSSATSTTMLTGSYLLLFRVS